MQGLFNYAINFNSDISNWDVSKVQNMQNIFVKQPVLTKIFHLGMFLLLQI